MRYKGFYAPGEFSLENIPFETLLMKLVPDLKILAFDSLISHNTGIDTEYWQDAGLVFQSRGEGFLFEGSKAIENFLTLDRVLEGKGSLAFSDMSLEFTYQNGKITFQGKGVTSLCSRIFGDLPWREGDFILKTGFFSSRLVFLQDLERGHIVYKKGHFSSQSSARYILLSLLKTLGLLLLALSGVVLLKKMLFIIVFLSVFLFTLYYFSHWQSRRFFKLL